MSSRNSRFDLSNNSLTSNIDEIMYYYQRNIREHIENIHEYNIIINSFLTSQMNINRFRNNIEPFINYNNNHNNNYNNRNNENNNRYNEMAMNGFLGFGTLPNIRNTLQESISINNRPLGNTVFRTRQNQHQHEDVIVAPSLQQITQATEILPYIETEVEELCPITREPMNNGDEICRIKYCGHIFKSNALMNWFHRNVRCPVCRYDIRDYIPPRTQEQPSHILPEIDNNMEIDTSTSIENEFDDIVRELIQEQTNIPVRNPIVSTLTNAIRSFVNQELQRIPVNTTTTDLIYSFDLPLSIDVSGNYRL